MKTFILISIFLGLSACKLAANNSTAEDSAVYGEAIPPEATSPSPSAGAGASTRFTNAQKVIQKNCMSCHTGFNLGSDNEWIQSGYVIAGNSDGSTLFQRIRGGNASSGSQNMPPSTTLSADEISTIKTWIVNILQAVALPMDAHSRTSAALNVLSVACASCHAGTQTANSAAYNGSVVPAFATYSSDSEFFQNGLVSAGDPAGSWLYRALKGHGNIGTMPANGNAISDASADSISNWILKMGDP